MVMNETKISHRSLKYNDRFLGNVIKKVKQKDKNSNIYKEHLDVVSKKKPLIASTDFWTCDIWVTLIAQNKMQY